MAEDRQPNPEPAAGPAENPGDNPVPGLRGRVESANKLLGTVAEPIGNIQTIVTLLGAVVGGLAFLNIEFGLLASLNSVFHSLAGTAYQVKLPLALALVAVGILNAVWLVRRRSRGRASLHWMPALAALVLAAGVWLLRPLPYNIAVLSFLPANASAPVDDVLGTELARLLAGQLGQSHESIRTVLASQEDISAEGLAAVAKDKGVDFVVAGTYESFGASLRLSTTVYDARFLRFLLENAEALYDLRDNTAALQQAAASQVLSVLPLYGGVRAAAAGEGDSCATPYECRSRGRQYYRWFSEEGYRRAIAAYQRAIELDPDYALAYAGLAEAKAGLAADLSWTSDFEAAEATIREATATARQALRMEPDSLESLRAMALVYIMRSFYVEADAIVRRLEEIAPDDAETLWLRGALSTDAAERLRYYQKAAELAPNLAIVQDYLGYQLGVMGQYEAAIPHLQAALAQNPYGLRSYAVLTQIYLAMGRLDEAAAQARLGGEIEPRYGAIKYLESFVQAAQGSTVEAVVTFEEAAAEHPELGSYDPRLLYDRPGDYSYPIDFVEGLRNQQPEFIYVYNDLGNLYRSAGRIDDAESSYRAALRLDPSLGIAHYNLASLLGFERGDWRGAEQEAAAAAGALPALYGAQELHGEALRRLGRYEQAEAALLRAKDLFADAPWPLFDLTALYLDMGRDADAKQLYEQARAMEPDEAYPYNRWAVLLTERGRNAEAIDFFQQAIDRIPDDPLLWSNLAYALRQTGDYGGALEACQKSVDLAPASNPAAYTECAWTHLAQGDAASAEEVLRQGLAARPEDPSLLSTLGRALASQGRYQEADRAYAQAVEHELHGVQSLYDWGLSLDGRGELTAAVEKYEAVRARYPYDVAVMTSLASAYSRLERPEDALPLLEQASQFDDAYAPTYKVWGDVLAQQGQVAAADARYQQALALNGEPDYVLAIAQAYQALGLPDKVSATFEAAIAARDDDAIQYYNWAALLAGAQDYPAAIQKYQEALRLDPGNSQVAYGLIGAYNASGDWESALAQARQLVDRQPDNPDAYLLVGALSVLAGQYEQAVDRLQEADRLRPGHVETLQYLAVALSFLGRFDEVDAAMDTAVQAEPSRADTLIQWASLLTLQERNQEAAAKLEQAAELFPEDATIASSLGDAYASLSQYEQAATWYERAALLDPANAAAHQDWALMLLFQGKNAEAAERFRQALELAPDNVELVIGLGHATLRAGNPEEAARQFEEATSMAPDNAEAWAGRGAALIWLDRSGEAVPMYSKAVELDEMVDAVVNSLGTAFEGQYDLAAGRLAQVAADDPDNDLALALWATVLRLQDQPEAAAEKLAAAIRLAPSTVWYRSGLARAQLALGDREAATETVLTAAELAPEHPLVVRLLAELGLDEWVGNGEQ